MVWLVALIALGLMCIQAWEAATIYAVLFLICLALWQIDKRKDALPDIPRNFVEPTQPKTKEFVMNDGLKVWLAALSCIATMVAINHMYYGGNVEWTVAGIPFPINLISCGFPALLALVLINVESAKTRPRSWFYRLLDFVPSFALSLYSFATAMLATFIFGLPTSIPTPVLTTFTALLLIWTIFAFTIYDLIRNQRSNISVMLEGYPRLQALVAKASAGSLKADIEPEPELVLPERVIRRPTRVIDDYIHESRGETHPWHDPDSQIVEIVERHYRRRPTIEARANNQAGGSASPT